MKERNTEFFMKEEKGMKFKKVMALIMSAALLVSAFAGCGGNSGNEGGGSSNKEQKEESGSKYSTWEEMFGEEYVKAREEYEAEHGNPYENIPEELKGTTVKFATFKDPSEGEDGPVIEKFTEETGINVEYVYVPQDTYFSQLSTMIASGECPDVYVENNEFFPSTLQISMPLDQVSTIDLNDPIWDTGYADFTTFGDHSYQLNAKYSVWQTSHVVYYNKKAFEENGIMTPQDYMDAGEWTMDNALAIMREFAALGDGYAGGQIKPEVAASAVDSAIFYLKDGRFVNGLGEAGLEYAYKLYYTLYDEGLNQGAGIENVMKGTVGLFTVDSFGLKKNGYFRYAEPDDLGYAPFPEVEGYENYTPSHYRAYGILSGSKNAEAAGIFLRYYLDPYNYDWDSAFLSDEAKDFYIEYVAGEDFSNKRFSFDITGTTLLGYTGYDGRYSWRQTLCWTNASQLLTAMESIRNEVDTAVGKANAILDELATK